MTDDRSPHRPRLYGRSSGKALSRRQAELMETLVPGISLVEAPARSLDPARLFAAPPSEIWFEIGFGGGEHLAGQAARRPDVGLIGCEPFLEGFGKVLSLIADGGLDNVRLHRGDARIALGWLTDASLDRVFILFPDPWPKTRHHKRRIVQPEFLDELARVLKPGGRVRFATDWADYANRALETFRADGRFHWTARRADDWRLPPADHVTTRYQEKGLGDCRPVFLDVVFSPDQASPPQS